MYHAVRIVYIEFVPILVPTLTPNISTYVSTYSVDTTCTRVYSVGMDQTETPTAATVSGPLTSDVAAVRIGNMHIGCGADCRFAYPGWTCEEYLAAMEIADDQMGDMEP